ncbi:MULTISPECIES: efflux RND transporter periplasmic adaptor subunit [Halomonadaceae]|uniref:efflux RND transporter periplasmic adaptor subunit n=1 Tax=Halomonadaceae TaxID=28256 RepID=UPI001598E9D7|nr:MULTISPECIES: efflux RND transporter periplasmic adaptor subunit [Halomonas]QJQ96895.1 efflux RND transporter periplasmic adaptor subunit [Halomonas sp. PA5]
MPPRLRRPSLSLLFAILLGLVLLAWLLLGDLQRFQTEAPAEALEPAAALTRVEIQESLAQAYMPRVNVQGQLGAWREVELRARSEGQVERLPVAQGARVAAGETLLQLAEEDLPAQLTRAEAELELARAELAAAERLRERDLISRTEQLRLSSAVAQAAAELQRLRQLQQHTRPMAPFDAVVDRLDIEVGDIVQVGEVIALLVDDRQLKAQGHVAQRDAFDLEPGLAVSIRLLDGSELAGELVHVASRAEQGTRTFAVEARLDNPERRRLAGASASLAIALPQRQAHRLSPALLVLDDQGQIGIKALDNEDRVVFHRVDLLTADSRQAWISGLPDRVRLITLGGGFVAVGERVTPIETGELGGNAILQDLPVGGEASPTVAN